MKIVSREYGRKKVNMENRQYKDSMFKNLFSIPEYSAELINALLDTNYAVTDIKNVTLSNVLKKRYL